MKKNIAIVAGGDSSASLIQPLRPKISLFISDIQGSIERKLAVLSDCDLR